MKFAKDLKNEKPFAISLLAMGQIPVEAQPSRPPPTPLGTRSANGGPASR
jgi:hypothetical protein